MTPREVLQLIAKMLRPLPQIARIEGPWEDDLCIRVQDGQSITHVFYYEGDC